MPNRLATLVLLSCAVFTLALGKRDQTLLMSFHVETSADEAPKFAFPYPLEPGGATRYFKKIPAFTEDQVQWFYPFKAKDGNSYGAAFKLDRKGTDELLRLSTEHQGRFLLANLPPSRSSLILIDRTVNDGIVVVWEGLSEGQFDLFREKLTEYSNAGPVGTAPPSETGDPGTIPGTEAPIPQPLEQ